MPPIDESVQPLTQLVLKTFSANSAPGRRLLGTLADISLRLGRLEAAVHAPQTLSARGDGLAGLAARVAALEALYAQ